MKTPTRGGISVVLTSAFAVIFQAFCLTAVSAENVDNPAAQIKQRQPWTTSRIKGSPEPPLPYRAQRVFQHLNFQQPTVLTNAPATDRLFVAEQKGRIYSIPNDSDCRPSSEPAVFSVFSPSGCRTWNP